MADVYRYRWGPLVDRWIAKTGTIAVQQGDFMRFTSSGKITPATASGNSTSLVGIALSKSAATDATNTYVRVALIGFGTVFEVIVASSTYTWGDGFVISAAQTVSEHTLTNLNSTATNVVAICAQDLSTAGTALLVEFLPGRFQSDIS
jgi:hypothetical protein